MAINRLSRRETKPGYMTFKSMGTLAFNQDSGTAHVKDVKWLAILHKPGEIMIPMTG